MRPTKALAGLVAVGAVVALALPGGPANATATISGWQQPVVLEQGAEFDAVSCASSDFCVTIQSQGYSWILNDGTWTRAIPVHVNVAPGGVSCTSPTFCMAVDVAGDYEVYNGNSWSSPLQLQGAADLTAVSCASATMCIAGDDQGNLYLYGKNGWGQGQQVLRGIIPAISCLSRTFCMAIDEAESSVFNGHTWSPYVPADPLTISDVSCGKVGVCVAVDQESRFVNYRHGAWSRPHRAERRWRETTGVSCAAGDFCVIVDDEEHALIRDGHGYGKPQRIDSDQQPGDSWAKVSCPTTSFCLAVNWAGDAIEYTG